MSQVAEQTAEVVSDVVEDTVDGVVDVVTVVRNNPVMLAIAGVLGAAAGVAGGYFIAKAQLKSYYEDLSAQEIAEAKAFYAGVYKTGEDGETLTPMEVLEQRQGAEAADAVRRYAGIKAAEAALDEVDAIAEAKEEQGHPADDEMDEELLRRTESKVKTRYRIPTGDEVVEEEKEEVYEEYVPPTRRNVFEDATFDYEEEVKHRTEDKPYIITYDEYFENDGDLDLEALTYFELDDTLVPESNEMHPIEDTNNIVGDDHLLRFGSGSKDPNKVFIRNPKIGTCYEITRSTGSYLEEVLGLPTDEPDSLKHSNRNAQFNRRRDFRRGVDG